MLLLLRLVLAHLITDFVLQPSAWVADRKTKHYKSPKLYYHTLLTTLVAYAISGEWTNWKIPLSIFLAHTAIDIWKSYRPEQPLYFVLDQFFHLLTLLLVVVFFSESGSIVLEKLQSLFDNDRIILLLSAYITVVFPVGYLIAMFTSRWKKEFKNEGLPQAGMIIGWTERALILTFILLGQFAGIGFLLTAKSIFRYVGLKSEERNSKRIEYILVGTLISFTLAIICSAFFSSLIQL